MLALHLGRVIITVKIMTTYRGCEYITPGKHYQVIGQGPHGCLQIINDYGMEISVRLNSQSAHLDRKGLFTVIEDSKADTRSVRQKQIKRMLYAAVALIAYSISLIAVTACLANDHDEQQLNPATENYSD